MAGQTSVGGIVLLVLGILMTIGGLADTVAVWMAIQALHGLVPSGLWTIPALILSFGLLLVTVGAILIYRAGHPKRSSSRKGR